MRFIAIIALIVGIGLAGGGLYLANKYIAAVEAQAALQRQQRQAQAPEMVRVAVAAQELRYGTKLEPEHVGWQEFPVGTVPDGTFTSIEDLVGDPETAPRIVLGTIVTGEFFLRQKVSEFGESPNILSRLSPGMRAFTIAIDAVSGVGGFIAPESRVDIMVTRRVSGQLRNSIVLQNTRVIAVDQVISAEQSRGAPRVGRTATVEVTPTEASKLKIAGELGRLSLTLRGFNDSEDTTDPNGLAQEITPEDIFGEETVPEPVRVVEEPKPTIRVRKGTSVNDLEMPSQ